MSQLQPAMCDDVLTGETRLSVGAKVSGEKRKEIHKFLAWALWWGIAAIHKQTSTPAPSQYLLSHSIDLSTPISYPCPGKMIATRAILLALIWRISGQSQAVCQQVNERRCFSACWQAHPATWNTQCIPTPSRHMNDAGRLPDRPSETTEAW